MWRAIKLLQRQHSTAMSARTCKRVPNDTQTLRYISVGLTIYNDEAVILSPNQKEGRGMTTVPQTTLGARNAH
jgi:hypothetical protein